MRSRIRRMHRDEARAGRRIERWFEEGRESECFFSDIGSLSSRIGVEQRQLLNYFSTRYGMEFRTWRKRARLRAAKRLISKYPDLPITEICRMVGVSDRSNLQRDFRSEYGISVYRYRELVRRLSPKQHREP